MHFAKGYHALEISWKEQDSFTSSQRSDTTCTKHGLGNQEISRTVSRLHAAHRSVSTIQAGGFNALTRTQAAPSVCRAIAQAFRLASLRVLPWPRPISRSPTAGTSSVLGVQETMADLTVGDGVMNDMVQRPILGEAPLQQMDLFG